MQLVEIPKHLLAKSGALRISRAGLPPKNLISSGLALGKFCTILTQSLFSHKMLSTQGIAASQAKYIHASYIYTFTVHLSFPLLHFYVAIKREK